MKYLLTKFMFKEMHWEKTVQTDLDFRTFGFCMTCTFVYYTRKLSLFCIVNLDCNTQLTNKHFKLLYSGAVQLSLRLYFVSSECQKGRPQWPQGLRHGPVAACLLRMKVQILPGAWMSVSCECCVFSDTSLCERLITCPQESYCVWCV
jgi:hypothetical protein